MGDRGETETEIEQSENELTGETNDETEQETTNDEDQPPPLEDIDDDDDEDDEKEMEDSVTEPVAIQTPTSTVDENDAGR